MMDQEELKQNLRRDVAGLCAGQKVRSAARALSRRYDDVLRPVGLNVGQYGMLVTITLTDDCSLTALAGQLGLERTTLIRNLKPLEREGLIEISDEGYRRTRSVSVTSQGLSRLEEAVPLWRSMQERLKEQLGEEGWKAANKGLDILSRIEG